MSRRKRLSAVATTALVAAFPVFPLFADEPSQPQVESTQAVSVDAAFVDPFAGFDETLLDVPDGQTAAFYRERADALNREAKRVGEEFKKNRPQDDLHTSQLFGQVIYGKEFKLAPVGSVSARVAAAFACVHRQLFDAPDVAPAESSEALACYYIAASVAPDDGEAAAAFFAERLAQTNAKTPFDLNRAIILRQALEIANSTRRSDENDVVSQADLDRLFDVPEGESAEFYRARRVALLRMPPAQKNDERWSNAAATVARRLADAADATPTERFIAFRQHVGDLVKSGRFDELRVLAEREAERAGDATNVADAARAVYLEHQTLLARLKAVEKNAQTFRDDPYEPRAKLPKELTLELAQIAAGLAELADDGRVPWTSDAYWAKWAQEYALRLEWLDLDVATQFRLDVAARLAHSADETEKAVCQELKAKISADRIIGAVLPFDANNLDGTPFDWSAYRGAPTLIEILRPTRKQNGEIAHDYALPVVLSPYCDAGLQRVIVAAATPEVARRFRENPKNDDVADITLVVATSDDWSSRLGFDATDPHSFLLVDADGRVLAGSDRLPRNAPDAPEIVAELRKLFPNVKFSTSARPRQKTPSQPSTSAVDPADLVQEAGDPLDGFDETLLDLPENASVEATRARLRSIQTEQIRLKAEYDARVLKAADAAGKRDEVFSYLSQGGPRPQAPLDPNSLAGKIYAFRVAASRRLA
ncbi:MAG: hypothetical protein IIW01_07325, partial [Thermoguttaceae bacterium]|nr:hypothetical protein [Thermoguttaceae bacterium]